MQINLALVLVICVAVSGIIWLIDHLVFAEKRKQRAVAAEQAPREPLLVEYARSFFPVFLLVLLLRTFVFEPFRIPSSSMVPTLLVGDFIVVSKFSYGLRLPVINTKILDTGSPERGDVAVFRYPRDPSTDFIKRVVGLPGDRIVIRNGEIAINGETVQSEFVRDYSNSDLLLWEKLGETEHNILQKRGRRFSSTSIDRTIPEGHYFVMGDNRDNSNDSRVWGFVPEENLVGRATYIWMHMNWQEGGVKLGRIGRAILGEPEKPLGQ